MKKYVVMLAGGTGSRMNASVNKILLPLCDVPVIIRSMRAFIPFADEMIIVCRQNDQPVINDFIGNQSFPFRICFAQNGKTRQDSVLNGLRAMPQADADDIILIHDAARCLVDADLVSRVIESVNLYGTGIPGIPVTSTYKACTQDSLVDFTPDRSSLFEIQTPQGFKAQAFIRAAMKAEADHIICTDDAGILEHYHIPVRVVPGSKSNIKLTEPQDLDRARTILRGNMSSGTVRIGMGYDVHRLVPNRKLILCGVDIPFDLGLLGHSDADVAVHALMDAMLGAAALGDIGKHFPDSDNHYLGISSMLLLEETVRLLASYGFCPYNADITIVAQKPKIMPFIPLMVKQISSSLNLPESSVNIKATTTESLGFEGRMEGISAYAVCTIVDKYE